MIQKLHNIENFLDRYLCTGNKKFPIKVTNRSYFNRIIICDLYSFTLLFIKIFKSFDKKKYFDKFS